MVQDSVQQSRAPATPARTLLPLILPALLVGVGRYSVLRLLVMPTATGVAVGLVVWKAPGHAGPDPATTGLDAPVLPPAVLPGPLAFWLGRRLVPRAPGARWAAPAEAATIGALFGTPVAAALVLSEALAGRQLEGALWDSVFAPLAAAAAGAGAGAGALTTTLVARPTFDLDLPPFGRPGRGDLPAALVLASAAALLGMCAVRAFPYVHGVFARLRHPMPALPVGGLVLGLLAALGGHLTLFKGLDEVAEIAAGPDGWSAGECATMTAVKPAALVVAASCGFRGGRIFPAVFAAAPRSGCAPMPSYPACWALLAITRQGWVSLFTAAVLVSSPSIIALLRMASLPAWLPATGRPPRAGARGRSTGPLRPSDSRQFQENHETQEKPMPLHQGPGRPDGHPVSVNPFYGEANPVGGMTEAPPKHRLPDAPLPPSTAYQVVHDELMLDGNSRLNLATFVTTWMEPQAGVLMAECRDKNMIDKDEYPRTAELERRCVAMLADLWNAPDPSAAVGCSTTGSSEACMLAGMALKRRWARRNADRYPGARPNLVMGVNVQVCWDKFCTFWEVEPRLVPMEGERFHLDPGAAAGLCDENTIGVVGILGSTFDGSYEPIAELCAVLDALQERTGLDVPVHVDGASGAMVAPFLDEDLVWDFRLPRVASINTSGHKYGLVYPGVGWALWRDGEALPEELVFRVNYLGGDMPTFALNFSRPGAQVVAQYYTFLRLGREGYRAVQQSTRDVAVGLAERVAALGDFRLLTRGDQLPVFAFTTAPDVTAYDVFDVSRRLREKGWLVPAYTFPPNREDLSVLRVVCRNGFSADLAELFAEDLARALPELRRQPHPLTRDKGAATGFHH